MRDDRELPSGVRPVSTWTGWAAPSRIGSRPTSTSECWSGSPRWWRRPAIAFQSGSGTAVDRPNAYGSGVDLTLFRHDVDTVVAGLEAAGLGIDDVIERDRVFDHEDTPQTFIVASAGQPTTTTSEAERPKTSGA